MTTSVKRIGQISRAASIVPPSLCEEEAASFRAGLKREPNALEWDLCAAMWSEHCSYKSSRALLSQLPQSGHRALCAQGENAGGVTIGSDEQGHSYALIFKMESHNHPSMIEPFAGAATGVGGIMRDIFTMGARPIANLNTLRFGALENPHTRRLLQGVVEGIAFYGNCMGVPTLAGEVEFDEDYNDNILVNAMSIGIARVDRICSARSRGAGNWVVYVGAKTGRDGIDGACMASRALQRGSLASFKSHVQIGDPFKGKCLMEACLQAMEEDLIVSIQDMGAAGLLSSSSEMSAKGECGMQLHLDQVPTREESMSASEIMLSESQERMLMVVRPKQFKRLRAIFTRLHLDCLKIGKVQSSPNLDLFLGKEHLASVPCALLTEQAPRYTRPQQARKRARQVSLGASSPPPPPPPPPPLESLQALLSSPRLCSKRWVWQQYDWIIRGQTLQGPGGEAALVRIPETGEILAATCDSKPRYAAQDAELGAMQSVCEAWRNITATGATPLAITNCLNFGTPEDPAVMSDFARSVEGIAKACRFFSLPVVSGNVSFYNETEGRSIPPTAVIGALGLLARDHPYARPTPAKPEQRLLYLLGEPAQQIGASLYLETIEQRREGLPPSIDLERERRHGDFLSRSIARGRCECARDLSCGGLLVKAALLAIESGAGVRFFPAPAKDAHEKALFWFGEDQARYLLCLSESEARALSRLARESDIPLLAIGELCASELLTLSEGERISVKRLMRIWQDRLPRYIARAGERGLSHDRAHDRDGKDSRADRSA